MAIFLLDAFWWFLFAALAVWTLTLWPWTVVIVKMFKRRETWLAIVMLLLFPATCPVTFLYGWYKVDELDIRSTMIAWSWMTAAALLLSLLTTICLGAGLYLADRPM